MSKDDCADAAGASTGTMPGVLPPLLALASAVSKEDRTVEPENDGAVSEDNCQADDCLSTCCVAADDASAWTASGVLPSLLAPANAVSEESCAAVDGASTEAASSGPLAWLVLASATAPRPVEPTLGVVVYEDALGGAAPESN